MTLLQIREREFGDAVAEIEWRTGAKVATIMRRHDGRLVADIFMDDALSQTVELVEVQCV